MHLFVPKLGKYVYIDNQSSFEFIHADLTLTAEDSMFEGPTSKREYTFRKRKKKPVPQLF